MDVSVEEDFLFLFIDKKGGKAMCVMVPVFKDAFWGLERLGSEWCTCVATCIKKVGCVW